MNSSHLTSEFVLIYYKKFCKYLDLLRLSNSVNCQTNTSYSGGTPGKQILSGQLGPADGEDRQHLIEHYLAARTGFLACERMVDALEKNTDTWTQRPKPGPGSRLVGWSLWAARTAVKRHKDSRPGSHNRPEFQRHRYLEVPLEDMRSRVNRIKKLLNIIEELKIESVFDKFYRIGQ